MLFQTFDAKGECPNIYIKGKARFDVSLDDATKTWSYCEFLAERDIKYASLFCGGKTLKEMCPEEYQSDFYRLASKMQSFKSAIEQSKISLQENCFYELVPEWFLEEHASMKDIICQNVFFKYREPENYQTLLKINRMVYDINNNSFINGKRIRYGMFGTKTGRLVSSDSDFNILTASSEAKKAISPNNDFLVEFDYNAMDPRVLMALMGESQPEEDVYNWIKSNVFFDRKTREESKIATLRWMYGGRQQDADNLSRVMKKEPILEKFYKNGVVKNIFGRTIVCDEEYKALSYIIQSTSNDLFFEQLYKCWELLKGKKSRILFCVHDSFVLDLCKEEVGLLEEIKAVFSCTRFGNFLTSARIGKSYGNMRKV